MAASTEPKPNARVTLTRQVGKRTREVTVTERQARHMIPRGWTRKTAAKPSQSGSQS